MRKNMEEKKTVEVETTDKKNFSTKMVQEITVLGAENSEVQKYEGSPYCTKCGGKGTLIDKTFGFPIEVKCDCVGIYEEVRKQMDKDSNIIAKKVNNDNLLNSALNLGIIPQHRILDEFSPVTLGERALEISTDSYMTITASTLEYYRDTMKNVLGKFANNEKLTYSLLFSAPNGFSKKTFVNSCLKLLMLHGKRVVPYKSLFELAELRLEYMTELTWRKSKTGLSDSQNAIYKGASYGSVLKLKEKSEEENKPKKHIDDMTIEEKKEYMAELATKNYSYKDYLDSDVLFCYLSSLEQYYVEISVLDAILSHRSMYGKPTIIMANRDIDLYKMQASSLSDIFMFSNLVTSNAKYATFSRALTVTVKTKRKKETGVQAGINI